MNKGEFLVADADFGEGIDPLIRIINDPDDAPALINDVAGSYRDTVLILVFTGHRAYGKNGRSVFIHVFAEKKESNSNAIPCRSRWCDVPTDWRFGNVIPSIPAYGLRADKWIGCKNRQQDSPTKPPVLNSIPPPSYLFSFAVQKAPHSELAKAPV